MGEARVQTHREIARQQRRRKLRLAILLSASLVALAPSFVAAQPDALSTGFADPPSSARPRVWWHWLNGNVSKDGIRKDLEWMKRSGLGGVQNFDVNFVVPQVVDKRLIYMTPEWREVFRYATELSDQLGFEFGIAASPGWSETGGPWVKPQDGMKKLAWSETVVEGGRRLQGVLAAPPSTTGPFQDLTLSEQLSAGAKKASPVYYSDVAVLAYRTKAAASSPTPTITLGDGKPLDSAPLSDQSFATGLEVPRGAADKPTVIELDYATPQTIRSASLFIPHVADLFSAPNVKPTLEALGEDGAWRKVADIALSTAPTTISFSPVTARKFRVLLASVPPARPYGYDAAPGFDIGFMATIMGPKPRLQILDLRLSPEARVNQFEVKAGFATAPDYYALDGQVGDDFKGVAPGEVIDLTSRMRPDGTLDWTPPKGTWRVVRLGWSLTGKTNHPATDEATGLEVDKLDASAVRNYLESYLQTYRDAVGPGLMGAHGVQALVTDSTEIGAFNWTPKLIEQFERLRGYDPRPWLPTLTGAIVGSRAQSDAFLYDFRRTIAELHASEHYGTVATVAREHDLKVYAESLEGWRPTLGDDMEMRRYADVPMSALWSYRREDGPRPFYLADMRGAASVSHLYGQNLVAAESMTSSRQPWAYAPGDLRRIIDLEFASGVNRPVIHSSVHQSVDDKVPGLSLRHIGQFFNRHETWAEMTRPWIDYIARSSFLLQQGRFVADVAYFYGEEAPVGVMAQNGYFTDVPTRYGYDYVDPESVQSLLKVDGGDLVAPSGARYRLLYLSGTSQRMTLPMLRRIAALAEAGATIVGEAPTGSPSLKDDPAEFAELARRLWSGQAVTSVGRGRVIAGKDVEGALRAIGVKPDVDLGQVAADTQVMFVHRRLADGDLYFLNNRNNRPEQFEARFRVTGKTPEIWRADTGASTPVSYRIEGNETVVPLAMEPEDSFFVVFRKPAAAPSRTVTAVTPVQVAKFDRPWTVRFQPNRGAPASTELKTLAPLNENADSGIKYFSGVATYSTTFKAPAGYRSGTPLLLDLGRVGDVAEVRVNGRAVGTLWHAPYRVDVGSAVKRGDNQLEVRVANLWVNRLIGDRQPGAKKVAYTVMPTYRADAPLRPSGLIGPVQLLTDGALR